MKGAIKSLLRTLPDARFDIASYYKSMRHDVMDRLKARGQLVQYVRYMDDVVLLAKSRWQLRRAIAALHAVLRPLHLRLRRVKRFIGRTSTGFDSLGYAQRPAQRWESGP